MSSKILDLAKATGEETADFALATILPEIVKEYGDVVVSEAVATVAGELIGAIFPRINNIRLSYKQNRLERNVGMMLQQLADNDNELSERIAALEQTMAGRSFLHQAGEMMLDNIVDEIQPEKVKYNVTGYTNLVQTDNANLDMALMFFKTLSQLNDIDVRILQMYDWRKETTTTPITPFNSEYDFEQLRYIKDKLVRLGLLRSVNQERFDINQALIIEYIEKKHKDETSKKPKGVKTPKFKKIANTDRYKITSLGMAFLQLISEQCDMSDLSVPDDDTE